MFMKNKTSMTVSRRNFVKTLGVGDAVSLLMPLSFCTGLGENNDVPLYLKDYSELYKTDPKVASIKWFKEANFGLFLHYGLYSLLGRGEWVQFWEKIPVAEYSKIKDKFFAEKFDADFITDLALEAEMKYINITTRHHDSFCLFNTKETDFNSVNSPAKRDLVAELAEACQKKGLGLCLYYSHGRDWKHPHAANHENWKGYARPLYDIPEPAYKYGKEHDLNKYVDFMHAQITELLTNYGSIASIWLDGSSVPMSRDHSEFRMDETYALIRKLQPQCLISYKWGVHGDEDYHSPELQSVSRKPEKFQKVLETGKPLELCYHIAGWGYNKENDGKHRGADSLWENLEFAGSYNGNLLLNTAPRPDGSIDPQDVKSLRELGERIRKNGFPKS